MVERAGHGSASRPNGEPVEDHAPKKTLPPVARWVIEAFGSQLRGPAAERPVVRRPVRSRGVRGGRGET